MSGTSGLILAIYLVLLLVGGLIGFLKAGSKISLFTSLGFAILLGLFEFVIPAARVGVNILLVVLLVFFAMRFIKGRKFMPAGLMSIVTLITLILRFVL